jgi:hypothetical protein
MSFSAPQRIYAKPGDLVKDMSDDEIGLVLSNLEPESRGHENVYLIQWPSVSYPIEMDDSALQNGWVVVVSRADVPTV